MRCRCRLYVLYRMGLTILGVWLPKQTCSLSPTCLCGFAYDTDGLLIPLIDAAEFAGVTHFYWSSNRGEVSFMNLSSRGIVGEGA
jgi:hypothetical protein